MYLIRGQHNLDFFKSQNFKKEPIHGTIGNFDGLHLGHQAILKTIKDSAISSNGKTVVFFYRASCIRIFCKYAFNSKYCTSKALPMERKI